MGNLSRYTTSFALAFAFASVVNALLVVAKEKVPAIMAAMRTMTGHHWISHAAIVLILFCAIGCALSQTNDGEGPRIGTTRLLIAVVSGIVFSGVLIAGFYLING